MTGILDWSHHDRGGVGGGWYHCRVSTMSRSSGRSAVAAAAYRMGTSLRDEAADRVHDYSRRSGVLRSFIVAPEDAPDWAHQPEALWNAVEASERRRNSVVARECELALPAAVGAQEREGIARAFAEELVDRYGVAVTVAIHAPPREGNGLNHHAHIMWTTRVMGPGGLGEKTRVLDDIRTTGPEEVVYLRQYAADLINEALERAGVDERVDARSFLDRGIDREPTEHLGPTATQIEREGKDSERGDRNREIDERNEQLDRLVDELRDIDAAIAAEQEQDLDDHYGPADERDDPLGVEEQSTSDTAGDRSGRRLTDEEKRAARNAAGRGEADASEPSQPVSDEEKRHARDSVRDAEDVGRRLGSGGIRHFGLSVPLWQHVAVFIEQVAEQAVEIVKGVWQRFLDWREGGAESDRGDDPGPDLTR